MAKSTTVRRRPARTRSAEAPVKEPAPRAVRTTTARAGTRRASRLPDAVGVAVRAAQEKKAEDLVVLDLREAGGFTDHFVICTGGSARQIGAIADSVRETLKRELDERPTVVEGTDRADWILLDYFDFVVHVFSRDCRAFYNLERLWGNAERIVPAEA